jgi:hypothetical protein
MLSSLPKTAAWTPSMDIWCRFLHRGGAVAASTCAGRDISDFAERLAVCEHVLWAWPTEFTDIDPNALALAAIGIRYGRDGVTLINGDRVVVGTATSFADAIEVIGRRMAVEAAAIDELVRVVVPADIGVVSPAAAPVEASVKSDGEIFAAVIRNAVRGYDFAAYQVEAEAKLIASMRPYVAPLSAAAEMVALAFTNTIPKGIPLPFIRVLSARFTKAIYPRAATASLEMFDGLEAVAEVGEIDWGHDEKGRIISHSTDWLKIEGGTCVVRDGKWVRVKRPGFDAADDGEELSDRMVKYLVSVERAIRNGGLAIERSLLWHRDHPDEDTSVCIPVAA